MSSVLMLTAGCAVVAAVVLLIPAGGPRHQSLAWPLGSIAVRKNVRLQRGAEDRVETAVLLDLTAALLNSGVGIEASLRRLARTVPGAEPLEGVHRSLVAGASWEKAVELVAEEVALREFCEQLSFAYSTGAPSARMLQAAAVRARAERKHAAEAAAEKLGVTMLLPLGACYLPAFVLLGVVPVVVSMLPEALGF